MNWQPSASLTTLRYRARVLRQIRDFFAARDVLEVETPLLSSATVTDAYIQSIPAMAGKYYLQTSPEYAMKRLLAANSGPIYQITKAFRHEEVGRFHNPEFSMLEWYRLGFDHHHLMAEVAELLNLVLQTPPPEKQTYAEVFMAFLNVDPHGATLEELATCAKKKNIAVQSDVTDRDTWLQILLNHCIEPHLGNDKPFFLYDFPASQAALAKVRPGDPALASRFEVYFKGMELANGFHELQDAKEQAQRFQQDLAERKKKSLPAVPVDAQFLAALEHGLPDCAGVALGIDRLILLSSDAQHIKEVLSFDFSRV